MTRRTDADAARASGRVSPTATDEQSASTNVWRLLEARPEFVDGMERARSEHETGSFRPFHRKNPRPAND